MFSGDVQLSSKSIHKKRSARTLPLFVGDFGEVAADPHFGRLGDLVAYRVSIDPAQFAETYGDEVKAAVNIGNLWFEIFSISGTCAARSAQTGLVLTTNYDPNETWEDRVLQIWCRNRMLTAKNATLHRQDIVTTLVHLARAFADGFSAILGIPRFIRPGRSKDVPYLLLPSHSRGPIDLECSCIGRLHVN